MSRLSQLARLSLVTLTLFLSGCFGWGDDTFDEPLAKLYIGRYQVGAYNVDWYYHSGIGLLSEPVIVAWTEGQAADDTLAESSAVYDIAVEGDTLTVSACEPTEVQSLPDLHVRVVVTEGVGCPVDRNPRPSTL